MSKANDLAIHAEKYLEQIKDLVDPVSILLPVGVDKTETGAIFRRSCRAFDNKRATVIKTAREALRLAATADHEYEEIVREAEQRRKDRIRGAEKILTDCAEHFADLTDLSAAVKRIANSLQTGNIVDRSPDVVERVLGEKKSKKLSKVALADIEGDD